MDRLLNGAIAWLFFLLAVMVAFAATNRKEGGGIADGDDQPTFGAESLMMVNPPVPDPLLEAPARPEPAVVVRPTRHAGRAVTSIVVHHSASAHGDVTAIDRWHRERGFDGVGYHYVICNGTGGGDGEVQAGRDDNVQGAHALGRNQGSLGVCLIGHDDFSPAQLRSLRRLLARLCRRHGITPNLTTIQRHHERCPGTGLNLEGIIEELAGE